ncbi:MAG: peptidylprolyl isomerase [Asticcacaulis sp.]|nr:peptidylprolyl isomerase [Asticcacaulis sp.]
MIRTALLLTATLLASPLQAAESDWRAADPQNVLVIDTEKGRLYVELHPEVAPKAVERVKLLARRGTYDGLLFHRVIPGFVAQTGNPNNHDSGKTELPNLKPEFRFRLNAAVTHTVVARPAGLNEGFMSALPYISVDETRMSANPDHAVHAWATHCTGTMGMGRDDTPVDSANSETYFMLAPTQRLDHEYTLFGQVIAGGDVLQSLASGEPPAHPDSMIHVRVLADMARAPRIEILKTDSAAFKSLSDQVRAAKGADFSICDLTVPARVIP